MSVDTGEHQRLTHSEAINRRFLQGLWLGIRLGLLLLVGGFALYAVGVLPSYVPPQEAPALVSEGADALVARGRFQPGWAWLAHLGHGDMLSLAGVLALIGGIFAGYAGLVPLLWARRDWVYLVLVLVQLAVFVLAGTGLAAG